MKKINTLIINRHYPPVLTMTFRLILGFVFLYASYEKIADPGSFAVVIQNYQLIPIQLINIVAIFLPWLEFYTAVCLILGWWIKPAALLVTIMNVIFIVALSLAYLRGLDIECGCFGTGSTVGLQRIGEDFILLSFSLYVYLNPQSRFALENVNVKQKGERASG